MLNQYHEKIRQCSLACLLFLNSSYVIVKASELTLKEAFEKALLHNENEKIAISRIDSAKASYDRAEGNYYPKLALKGSYTFLDQLDDQKSVALNLSQNLFKGGRDELNLKSQNLNIENQKLLKIQDQLNLFKDVSEVYHSHWQNHVDVKNLKLLKEQSEKRRNEIRSRVSIGRSRKGELLQAESQLATVESNLLNAEGLKNESLKKLSSLIGVDELVLIMPETISEVKSLSEINHFLDKTKTRAELEIKEIKWQITDLDLVASKRNHLPTVDLTSNYYLNKRSGNYRNSDWDLAFSFSIPLFEGGSTEALVRESVAKKTEAYLALNDQKRKVESDVLVRYETVKKYLEQLKAGVRAYNLARENYDEALKDYRLGLVSNLDTLSALNTYLDAKRTYDKTKIQARASLEQLNLSVGIY